MKFSENFRSALFWTLDNIKGNKVKNNYKEISFILENYNSLESRNLREKHLQNILEHSVNTVSKYKSYKKFKTLNEFPIIDKKEIRQDYKNFISNKQSINKYQKVATSGSTGTPFNVYIDAIKKARNTADTIYFAKAGGFNLGNKLYYLKLWSKEIAEKSLINRFRNIKVLHISKLTDHDISVLINDLKNENSPISFLAYASGLRQICKYLDRVEAKPILNKVASIIAMSETLSIETKTSLRKYFGVDTVSRYSNVENGILSQQMLSKGNNFHINWASYYVELLDLESDTPAQQGELGRVVITDLFNYAMPMIRYDTGDVAIMDNKNDFFNGAPSFSKVYGRKMDLIYNTNGAPLSPYVAYEMEHFQELKQFQLIQEGKKQFRVILNIDGTFNQETNLIENLKSELGEDASIIIDYVNEIPVLNSGKRKMVINNYIKEHQDQD